MRGFCPRPSWVCVRHARRPRAPTPNWSLNRWPPGKSAPPAIRSPGRLRPSAPGLDGHHALPWGPARASVPLLGPSVPRSAFPPSLGCAARSAAGGSGRAGTSGAQRATGVAPTSRRSLCGVPPQERAAPPVGRTSRSPRLVRYPVCEWTRGGREREGRERATGSPWGCPAGAKSRDASPQSGTHAPRCPGPCPSSPRAHRASSVDARPCRPAGNPDTVVGEGSRRLRPGVLPAPR